MQKRFKFVSIVFLLMMLIACSNNGNFHQDSDNVETNTTSENREDVELTISVAVSLKEVMDVIQEKFSEEHPKVILKFNFGGSGSLQQQISQGAPADLFFQWLKISLIY